MKIEFCGASTGVTGSCHLLTSGDHKILLDCGQFQGGKAQEALNYEPFPFDASEIECVVLSHAHIDHCGRLPLLMKRGFRGKIYCTDATADLLDVMLKDSGYIHEKDAEWQNRKAERSGRKKVEPLYTYEDSVKTLELVQPVLYDQLINLNDDMRIVFAREDLSEEITPEIERMYFTGGITAVDTQLADDFMLKNVPNTLVSYTVYPQDPVTGSYCYKMLIDAGTHELFYFRKHRINRKTGPGFLVEDIMRITADRFRDEMR